MHTSFYYQPPVEKDVKSQVIHPSILSVLKFSVVVAIYMNMRETLQIDITSNQRVCMYIRMEKLKITVLAGILSSSSEVMSKSFFSILRCVDAFHASPVLPPFLQGM